jgi:hypothetical protein
MHEKQLIAILKSAGVQYDCLADTPLLLETLRRRIPGAINVIRFSDSKGPLYKGFYFTYFLFDKDDKCIGIYHDDE